MHDFNGDIYLEFDVNLIDENQGLNVSSIDESVLDISVVVTDETKQASKLSVKELNKIEWTAISFKQNQVKLSMKLENALFLSQEAQDYLRVEILDPLFFID